jgi:membrane peptidoglycan carboxypeptidase
VTQPGYFHTAGSAHLEGIDLAGKTGTAQVMSHEALERTNKGFKTRPNVWFVGVTPRRNPELVVAVLWQNGEFSYYPARLGARVVAAYVEKQRRLAHNLVPPKAPAAPVEVGAVWTTPSATVDGKGETTAKLHAGKFLVGQNGVVQPSPHSGESARSAKADQAQGPPIKNQTVKNETVKTAKQVQARPDSASVNSAKLNSPALPGKTAQVKPQ